MAQHPHPLTPHRAPVSQSPLDSGNGTALPEVFAAAVGGIGALRPRPGLEFEPLPAPRRLASHSHALSVTAVQPGDEDEAELGSGRFVLLYEPEGHEEWHGSWRCVTFLQADLEPEIAEDPLVADVTWSWLREALSGLNHTALGGTVSRCASSGFGELADQGTSTSVELRASWSPLPPLDEDAPGGPAAQRAAAAAGLTRWTAAEACSGLAAHFAAWTECLATAVGLPPELAGVARLPRIGG
ncbi:DUF3000 domain-containing protein [Actinospica sp.]|jgi:hypothetical protein|uniref:DUF3000 domain-containing protein n=1 Tax=Actinospica sp. TaxID=1872142 RepID=UPI002D0D8403|nr:DUF3000 domain-containing protein [Actinospica sp.]HWG25981.1 DUF3000 domain-containing protein [Actinospica sp.]